jgi:hypothetical protein
MTQMEVKWTTDKPSKPGFYWYQTPGMRARVVEVQSDTRHNLFVVHTGMRLMDLPTDEIAWAGPLVEPPR